METVLLYYCVGGSASSGISRMGGERRSSFKLTELPPGSDLPQTTKPLLCAVLVKQLLALYEKRSGENRSLSLRFNVCVGLRLAVIYLI